MRTRYALPLLLSLGIVSCNDGSGTDKPIEPISVEQYAEFQSECMSDLKVKIAKTVEGWHLTDFTHFDLDQTTGELVFSDDEAPRVRCSVQIIGTLSQQTNTWLWAWESPWVVDEMQKSARRVRDFGERRQLTDLTNAKYVADEAHAWNMTAIAAKLEDAEGAYRVPNRDVYVFMILTSISEADQPPATSRTGGE